MLMARTTLITPDDLVGTRYSIHVRHLGSWMRATEMDSLREAEIVAEVAHRRSGLPIEVRSETGAVCLAFEPAHSTWVPAAESAVGN